MINIYCISMPNSAQRQESFIKEASREGISFKFWDGFQAKELKHPKMSHGQIGCYLAHLSLWQHLIHDEVEHAIILEDDVRITSNFIDKFYTIVSLYFDTLEPDFIYLGYSEFGDFYNKMYRYKRINDHLVIPGYPCGTFAYWINIKTIKKVYKALRKPLYAVDNAMYDTVIDKINHFACIPKLVVTGEIPSIIRSRST